MIDWREVAAAEGVSLETVGLREWCRWLWRHELGLSGPPTSAIANDADFFALGGDSLAAARLCADLRLSGVDAGVATLFRHPLFDDFCRQCVIIPDEERVASDARQGSVTSDQEPFDLTPLQLAYALGSDGIPGVVRASPCVAVILHSDTPVTSARWSAALDSVVSRYDVLRLIRCDDWRQRVVPEAVPEFTEIPFDLTDEQFRDILRRTAVNPLEPPAVRALVRQNRPTELGLIFNYLALDSISVAAVLRDLAGLVIGSESAQPKRDIRDFHRHAVGSYAAAENGEPLPVPMAQLPPAPAVPTREIPEYDAVFESQGRVFTAETAVRLGRVARALGVTLNSLLLHAYGAAVGAATGQRRITVNVPIATRPAEAPEALGQFTDLVLCECGEGLTARMIHDGLGTALARPDTAALRKSAERQRYPVVFTSLLGSPLAESLADGRIRTTWTHTRTPAVLIDCQVTPVDNGGIEIRWDFPREVVDREFIEQAFADFDGRLLDLLQPEVQAGAR